MWKIFKPANENCAAVYSISEEAESGPSHYQKQNLGSITVSHMYFTLILAVFFYSLFLEIFHFCLIGTQLSLIRPLSFLYWLNLSSHLCWKFQDLWLKQPTKWAAHIFASVSSISPGPSELIFDSRYL